MAERVIFVFLLVPMISIQAWVKTRISNVDFQGKQALLIFFTPPAMQYTKINIRLFRKYCPIFE